jgi:iron complex outermembrane receptor protein
LSLRRRGARPRRALLASAAAALALGGLATGAHAQQRSAENALAASDDAFGSVVGNERTGIYGEGDVRGFSPIRAGNIRVEGVYFDQQTFIASRARAGSRIRVGIAALDYSFPAPTGIVDFQLRQATPDFSASLQLARNYYGGKIFELDLRGPIVKDRLTVTGGISYLQDEAPDGARVKNYGAGAVPRLRLGERSEVTVILGHFGGRGITSRILVSASGAFLPPLVEPRRYLGQTWAVGSTENSNFGAIWRQALGSGWSLRSGAFFSRQLTHKAFTEIFMVSDPLGNARHNVVADPARRLQSYSGEAQLTWAVDSERLKNRFLFTVRARDKLAESGGSDSRDLGPVRLGELDREAEPDFAFRPVDLGKVRQATAAIGYMGRLTGLGQFNFGLQKTDYRQSFRRPGLAETRTVARPWLYNATLVLAPGPRWLAYASYVKGLEETGVAPENAVNRNETLPAARTTQFEGGIRGRMGGLTLAASGFQIQKPYFTLDAADRFTDLGEVRHRGLEASLSGAVLKRRLTFLLGGLVMAPEVVGEARALGRVGERPVGVAATVLRLDAEYQTGFDGLSVTAAALHNGRRAASVRPYAELGGAQLFAPGFTTLDLGLRYRFVARGHPMTTRAVLANVFDKRTWGVIQANSYRLNDTRRLAVFLSADF